MRAVQSFIQPTTIQAGVNEENYVRAPPIMVKLSAVTKFILALNALVFTGIIAMPISNLFIQREALPLKSTDPEFQTFSKIFQRKCVDCHTPGMTQYPVYKNFPIADRMIAKDIEMAQRDFLLTREHLTGEKVLDSVQLSNLSRIMQTKAPAQSMPPLRYVILHWDASLSDRERAQILEWIEHNPYAAGN